MLFPVGFQLGGGGGMVVVTQAVATPAFTSTGVVQLANLALQHLAVSSEIASLDEDSAEARVIRRAWDFVRDTTLTQAPWGFATAQATLARLGVTATRWQHAYALPADCLLPLELVTPRHVVRREERLGFEVLTLGGEPSLVCDVPDAELRYTARVLEPERWPIWFQELVSYRLAAQVAMPLTKAPAMQQAAWNLYLGNLRQAMAQNARASMDGVQPRTVPSAFEAARGGRFFDPSGVSELDT